MDTHAWQFAQSHYLPKYRNQNLTATGYSDVGDKLRKVFGPERAGWAYGGGANPLPTISMPASRSAAARAAAARPPRPPSAGFAANAIFFFEDERVDQR